MVLFFCNRCYYTKSCFVNLIVVSFYCCCYFPLPFSSFPFLFLAVHVLSVMTYPPFHPPPPFSPPPLPCKNLSRLKVHALYPHSRHSRLSIQDSAEVLTLFTLGDLRLVHVLRQRITPRVTRDQIQPRQDLLGLPCPVQDLPETCLTVIQTCFLGFCQGC